MAAIPQGRRPYTYTVQHVRLVDGVLVSSEQCRGARGVAQLTGMSEPDVAVMLRLLDGCFSRIITVGDVLHREYVTREPQ